MSEYKHKFILCPVCQKHKFPVIVDYTYCPYCGWWHDDVSEELEGAEKYMEMYISTNDVSYYDMAKDELHHAGILIKKHYEKADSKEKSELEEYELERQELLKRLEKIHKEVE